MSAARAEAVTRLGATHVPDADFADAYAVFDAKQLTDLTFAMRP